MISQINTITPCGQCCADLLIILFLPFAASQSVKKIIEINPYMLGTMAGGAADCQFWHRNLGIKVPLFVACAKCAYPIQVKFIS